MSGDYIYVTDRPVIEIFTSCSRRERDGLLKIFESLAKEPFQRGDCVQTTRAGRDLQVKRSGKWLITFWADHPVTELRIVAIKRLTG